jgi:hypothetical protein
MAFNLVLSDQHEHLLGHLMEMSGLSKKDVIQDSLTLMGWAMAESAKGNSIAAVDEARSVFREIQTAILARARLAADRKKRVPAHA